jgi:DNA-directed RNA polymerase subunit M/transcription elongation factor TFIIS
MCDKKILSIPCSECKKSVDHMLLVHGRCSDCSGVQVSISPRRPKPEPKEPNVRAEWFVSLETECPSCGRAMNIWWDDLGLEPGEPRTAFEVVCTNCDHIFLVDCEY